MNFKPLPFTIWLCIHGCVLWRIDSKKIRALETAFNMQREIWRLPRQCHILVLHCVAEVQYQIFFLNSYHVLLCRNPHSSDRCSRGRL